MARLFFHFVPILAFLILPVSLRAEERKDSVYRISRLKDGGILLTASLANVVPLAFASRLIHRRCPCDSAEVNGLDRSVIGNANGFADTLSDITVVAAMVAPLALDVADLGFNSELARDVVVYAETLAVSGALVTLTKYAVQRPLPRTYAGDPELVDSPGGYRSFYSGHATMAFAALSAAAVTANLRHHAGVWPWLVTGAVGLSVAGERVAAGRHFYTDVAVGMVAGLAVGIAVPLLHANNRSGSDTVSIYPLDRGAQLVWSRAL